LRILSNAIVSGLAATATSTAALAIVAVTDGKGAAQPLNATSHLVYGDEAADFRDADVDHTVIGFGTHAAATIFWAAAYEASLKIHPPRPDLSVLGRAASIGLLAAVVDYTITPRRFTPGWELVLSKKSMAVVYVAMATGFAGAALGRTAR
jgi:hypothetical protein